ncbi:hypothetical protein Q2941_17410 [Bradyrhizobium sp. UFLA05-153]
MKPYDPTTTCQIQRAAIDTVKFMVSEDLIEFNFKRCARDKIEVRARATGSALAVVALLDERDLMDDCA